MRDTIKGACIGAFVAAAVSVLLAQTTPSWTSPRTWATDDLLTAAQFNAQIRDNFLNLRGFAACAENGTTGTSSAGTVLYGDCRWDATAAVTIAELGCTGTRNSSTVLFGDCTWAEIPTQYVTALDQGTTTTTSTTYVNAGNAATIGLTSGSVSIYTTGRLYTAISGGQSSGCRLRLLNTTTSTTIAESTGPGGSRGLVLSTDTSPSYSADNVYQLQLRDGGGSGSNRRCEWTRISTSTATFLSPQYRGIILFST